MGEELGEERSVGLPIETAPGGGGVPAGAVLLSLPGRTGGRGSLIEALGPLPAPAEFANCRTCIAACQIVQPKAPSRQTHDLGSRLVEGGCAARYDSRSAQRQTVSEHEELAGSLPAKKTQERLTEPYCIISMAIQL